MLLRPNKFGINLKQLMKYLVSPIHTGNWGGRYRPEWHGWHVHQPIIVIGPPHIPWPGGIAGPIIGGFPVSGIGPHLPWNPWDTVAIPIGRHPDLSQLLAGATGDAYADAGIDRQNWGLFAGAGATGTLFTAAGSFGIGNILSGEGSVEAGKGSAEIGGEIGLMRDGEFDPHADLHAGVELTGLEAKGKINVGGFATTEAEAKIGHAEAKGNVTGSLFDKDGNLSPNLEAKASAEATVAEGKIKTQVGSDTNNYHAEAEGKVLTANAEATASVSKDGVEVKAGAEAYVAKGSASGGITILGVKIDATVSGGVGGAEATLGGKATGTSVSGEIGAGLGVGGSVEVSVDWSNNVISQKYNEFKKGFANTIKKGFGGR